MENSLKTINILSNKNFVHEDIYLNLLLLFKINNKLFKKLELFKIFIIILESYLIASKKFISSNKDNLIEKDNYILLQETTILQLLLEFCSPDSSNENLIEIQKLIFNFIHQRFIEKPVLVKILHFQTYDPNLLKLTVNGIESMRIFNFIF
jgi:integrator complex subunit 2